MKKNIVIVVSALNMGGAQRVVSILANKWSKKSHNVSLICTFSDEVKSHYLINKNVNIINLTNSPLFPGNKLLNLLWKLFSLRKLIKCQNPDIVISFLARVNLATALATIGIKSRIILCERTWPPFTSLNQRFIWFYRILFRRVSKIIVQTNKSKSWLENNFPKINVGVIPNPVVYPLPSEKKNLIDPRNIISNEKRLILASGRLHKFKQFHILIKAFSLISKENPNWDLVILGEGEERQALEELIHDLDLTKRVFLPGSVGNISVWYEKADLFVLSSIVEGFPNVLLEAMSYGIPSVSFDCDTGPRDMIQNKINGLLVDPNEKELGLSNAISLLTTEEEFRSYIALNSIEIRDKFSETIIMKTWDGLLESKN
tara:strand:- start:648 stop:1766 length:1119 start_codon:yes stop_codon:yes gene_type:complete